MGHISLHLCMPSIFFIIYYKLGIANFTLCWLCVFCIPINNLQLLLGTHLNYLKFIWSFQILLLVSFGLNIVSARVNYFSLLTTMYLTQHPLNHTVYQCGCWQRIDCLMCIPHVASLPIRSINWSVIKKLEKVFI